MKFRLLFLALACFSSVSQAQMRLPNTVNFAPAHDPWPLARERWLDINNNPFNAWLTNEQPNGGFSYDTAQVNLTFDGAPEMPYFVGHIRANGLKPNFSYQLKLVGKPQRGTRGWGALGDDLSNERLGKAGRWWCDSQHAAQTNFDDAHYYRYYKYAPPGREHNIYGYQYMGEFVTDATGNADVDISGQYSYHITWASWQGGIRDTLFGTFSLRGNALNDGSFYGYGSSAPSDNVTLYYEYQADRINPVKLPSGNYKCRFVLTEETFHNTSFLGGYWKGVLATQDYDAQGKPDKNAANDVNFVIGARAPILSDITPTFTKSAAQGEGTFTAVYRDADNDLRDVFLKVGNGPDSFICHYALHANKLFVRSGSGPWQGGSVPGEDVTLSTSSGELLCRATVVTKISSGVRVVWRIKAAAQWANTTQTVGSYAKDLTGLQIGWNDSAWWQTGINQPPANVNLTPRSSSSAIGEARVFTATYADSNGAADIVSALLDLHGTRESDGYFRTYYDARRNLLYLYANDGVTLTGGFAPGSNHVISNVKGSLDCASTSVIKSGNNLTINWALTPLIQWAGNGSDNLYSVSLFARDWQGAYDGYDLFGSWTIVAN